MYVCSKNNKRRELCYQCEECDVSCACFHILKNITPSYIVKLFYIIVPQFPIIN